MRHNFWNHTNRSTMQQKLFQKVFIIRSSSFLKQQRKGTAKATSKIEQKKKIYIYIYIY